MNADPIVSSSPVDVLNADKIILPGVGHFGKAMENLASRNLIEALNEAALVKKKPFLGICLGMQLMMSKSEEGNAAGLNWFDGEVVKFKVDDTLTYKVPHIGWNSTKQEKASALMSEIDDNTPFYFVHAYHVKMNDSSSILNTTSYGYNFVSAVENENIFGVQYHPEKSHDAGEQLFKNFLAL